MIFLRNLVLGFCLFAAAAPAAQAHAYLKRADPAAGSTIAKPPARLLLTYTEALAVPFCTVTVTDAAGHAVQTAKPAGVPGHAAELTVPLHITAPGKYTVIWHALSADTHKTKGSFSFTVGN